MQNPRILEKGNKLVFIIDSMMQVNFIFEKFLKIYAEIILHMSTVIY